MNLSLKLRWQLRWIFSSQEISPTIRRTNGEAAKLFHPPHLQLSGNGWLEIKRWTFLHVSGQLFFQFDEKPPPFPEASRMSAGLDRRDWLRRQR